MTNRRSFLKQSSAILAATQSTPLLRFALAAGSNEAIANRA
jgi:hypothetical protein